MSLGISYDVRTADGTAPMQRTRALPELPGSEPWKRPLLDRVGGVVAANGGIVAGAGLVAGIAGALLTRHATGGIIKPLLGGVGAALAGTAGALGIGMFAHRNDDDAPTAPAGQTAPSTTVHGTEHVKVMTYNLHGGMGGPGKFSASSEDLDRLAETIRREQPDVLIVQESDSLSMRSTFTDTLSELSHRLNPDSAVEASPGTLVTGRQQYSGVMTFHGFTIDNARSVVHGDPMGNGTWRRTTARLAEFQRLAEGALHLEHHGADTAAFYPRGSIDTIVRSPGGNDIRVAGGHYSGPNKHADYPATSIIPMARALGAWHGATLFGADFNVSSGTTDGAQIDAAFASSGMADAFTSAGIAPGTDPRRRSLINSKGDIDRIYASSQFHVDDVHVVHEPGDPASDHRPVVASLTLSGD